MSEDICKTELTDVVLLCSKYVMAASKMPALVDKCVKENKTLSEATMADIKSAMDESIIVCELSENVIDAIFSDLPYSEKKTKIEEYKAAVNDYINNLDDIADFLKKADTLESSPWCPLPSMLLS